MEKLTDFVAHHMNDDTARLILDRAKWPDIDMELAVNCIESRRKLRDKVPEWYNDPRLVFPVRLSAEQCSSSSTAAYKASLASRIAGDGKTGWKLADLTGGLGIDSWFFSKKASEVLYCEMQEKLCMAASHNFRVTGAENISVMNCAVTPSSALQQDKETGTSMKSPTEILHDFRPDIIYLDPARRSGTGKKVFLIEDCTPDVLTLKNELFTQARHILLKLSPMADISMVTSRLGSSCREVHITASGGECKELLIWMDREWSGGYSVTACEMHGEKTGTFSFCPDEEKAAVPDIATAAGLYAEGQDILLFEPGKALMKAGAFNLLSQRYGLRKLARSTHYYIIDSNAANVRSDMAEDLGKLGKFFRVVNCRPLDKKSIKEAGAAFPNADVTARNIPMDTETLRKKLSSCAPKTIASSKCQDHDSGKTQQPATGQERPLDCNTEDIHIFGLKSDTTGNLLFTTVRQTMERKI